MRLLIVRAAPLLVLASPLVGCSKEEPAQHGVRARPVTVTPLLAAAPPRRDRVTGVVEPHRREPIGFEVSGRIERSIFLGKEVKGPELDDAGEPIGGEEGDVIATLDPTRYRQSVRAAELRLRAAAAREASVRIEADELRPIDVDKAEAMERGARQELNAAEAALDNATRDFRRAEELVRGGTISRSEFDRAKSAFDNATATAEAAREAVTGRAADVRNAEASLGLARSQLELARAEVAEAEQGLELAHIELEDCTLRAPFDGRITEVHSGRGSFVQPGEPVVTLTLMDPMKVVLTVSAEENRRIQLGAGVRLTSKDLALFSSSGWLPGIVMGKAEVADPATRTFRIEVMARNLRRDVGADDVMLAERVMPVLRRRAFRDGPLFVAVECLERDAEGDWVYRIPGARFGRQSGPAFSEVFRPERMRVELGEARMTLISYPMVHVRDGSGLEEGDLLLSRPTPAALDGVTLDRSDWALLPGDLVSVELDLRDLPGGYWVPIRALTHLNGRTSLFVVEDSVCREIVVALAESLGDRRRVESDELTDGMLLVVSGSHYLATGDRVVVTAELDPDEAR